MAEQVAAPNTAADIVSQLGIQTNVDAVSEETGSDSEGSGTEEAVEGVDGDSLPGSDGVSAAEDGKPDEVAEKPAADAVKPQDAAKTKLEAFRALFTDEALATPEGVKAAATALREREIKHHDTYRRTVQRERVAKETTAQARRAQETYTRFNGQIQGTLQLLQQGTPEQALHALGVLRGKAGIDAYEELTSTVIGIKKNPPPADSPKLQALENELKALKGGIEHAQVKAENDQWRGQVAAAAAHVGPEGKPVYPAIAHFVKVGNATLADVVRAVEEDFVQHGIAPKDSIDKLNRIWMAHVPAEPAAPAATAKGVARLAGKLPGRAARPAAAAAGSRELSEEERMAELAADPGFLASLGI
jgi:hypothetical protein